MSTEALYPPAPADVPAEITRLDNAYRVRVVAMIVSLFLFLLLYLALVAVVGLIAYWLLALPMPRFEGRGIVLFLVLKFGGALAAVLLWLFLFKGLFKGQHVDRSAYLSLSEKDYPVLFDFIRRVYADTGSPRPRRVYVSAEVNAALVYNTSLLNLIVPPRKDLLIGMGLVNVVDLAEFKAILAHEFGHFAQRSVGLGSYLYIANRVMYDVIYSRDALDRFVDTWSAQDIRISFPAWGLKGALWGVRKVLAGAYQGMNLLHLSLSRQMEFNADNVAVSVTGSDALIHGLSRVAFASECLGDAARSLDAAADHALFTDDLFYHQTQAATRLRRLRKDERAGLPPELPVDPTQKVQVFRPVDDGIPERYRSHPTDSMRELNAKRYYVRSPRDDRSPWRLFGDAAELKRGVTAQFYQRALGRREDYESRPAPEVQAFIDAEHAECTYDPRYHGLYDDRLINPGEIPDALTRPWPSEQWAAWLAGWPQPGLQGQVEAQRQRQAEVQMLARVQSGLLQLNGKKFTFRDEQYHVQEAGRLLKQVMNELDDGAKEFERLDRDALLSHWSLARHLDDRDGRGSVRATELRERYRFQMTVQRLFQTVTSQQDGLQGILNFLSTAGQLSQADFAQVRDALANIHVTLARSLDDAKRMSTPSLTNVPAGSSLYALIVDRSGATLPKLAGDNISGEWLGNLLTRLQGVLNRVRRVHFKSLGALLAYQEKLTAEWRSASADHSPSVSRDAAESAERSAGRPELQTPHRG
jgi:Zn-dependent protease with chaperone function